MGYRYSQIFTLADLFNNELLKNKLPYINYKEKTSDDGNFTQKANVQTVRTQVFNTSKTVATFFYKPLIARPQGNNLLITGTLMKGSSLNDVVNSVYSALMAKKNILGWTANNTNMIRDALKESERNKKYGINTKLYLRVQSIQEILGMDKAQLNGLMENIMENLLFSDNFPETQKKYNVENLSFQGKEFKERKLRWKYKVGDT